jgi:hypothetical protein
MPMKKYLFLFVLTPTMLLAQSPKANNTQQFTLFDAEFTYTKEDADNSKPSKSHYYVYGHMLNPERPKDWSSPVDFRNGTVHIRLEVILPGACVIFPIKGKAMVMAARAPGRIRNLEFTKKTYP